MASTMTAVPGNLSNVFGN